MCMKKEHYHCCLCGEPFYSAEEAESCFWNHTELEILRWVVYELVAIGHFSPETRQSLIGYDGLFTFDIIDKLNDRFKVAEIDENGWLWSLVIEGRRL